MNDEILIKQLIQKELDKIIDPIVRAGIGEVLVEPTSHQRKWDYSTTNELFTCWLIGKDSFVETSIIYCKQGFGPKTPWGLVSNSIDYFGMDFAWYNNLLDCYLESFHAGELPIWGIEKIENNNTKEIIVEKLTLDKAFAFRDSLSDSKQNTNYKIFSRK
jgi:hypothetical protein